MSLPNLEALDHLARLLATENIYIRHNKVKTASFDTVSRVLTFPIWKTMSHELYTMLAAHEVGHALWTKRQRLDDMAKLIDPKHLGIAAAYLNIVEDARIERLIKSMYPGVRPIFATAYADLFDRNLFGTAGADLQSRCFIDRANLYFKVGPHVTLQFSDVEKDFLTRMEHTETFEDVLLLTQEIFEWAKENNEHPNPAELPEELIDQIKEAIQNGEIQESDDEEDGDGFGPTFEIDIDADEQEDSEEGAEGKDKGQSKKQNDSKKENSGKGKGDGEGQERDNSDGDEDTGGLTEANRSPTKKKSGAQSPSKKSQNSGPPPEPVTQKKLDENIVKFNDEKSKEMVYLSLPKPVLKNIVEDYKSVHKKIRSSGANLQIARQEFEAFRKANYNKINYLFTQFEMKKQAERYMRIKRHKTGSLDTLRLHAYKYEDDLFKSIATVTDAKNHALLFVIDWSGSMAESMPGTIEQLVNLTSFCRKAQIPFEVYSLTSGSRNAFDSKPGNLSFMNSFKMKNYLSSKMNEHEYYNACVNLFAFIPNGRWAYGSYGEDNLIHCTPLDEAIITTIELIKELRTKTRAEIVNAVFLTDGQANTVSTYLGEFGQTEPLSHHYKYVIEDSQTRKQYEFSSDHIEMTPTMLRILRDRENINAVGFYVTDRWDSMFFDEDQNMDDKQRKQFEQDGHIICTSWGFSELYVIRGGSNLRVKSPSLAPPRLNGVPIQPGSPTYLDEITQTLVNYGKSTVKERLVLDSFIKMIA